MRAVSDASANLNGNPKYKTAQATTRLLLFCWLVVTICLVSVGRNRTETIPATSDNNLVNPNNAPWWELTILPEIGPALAREIVAYRELQRTVKDTCGDVVFKSLGDLDGVRGIGPKTIARLAPYLTFGDENLAKSPGSIDDHGQPQNEQH